MKTQAFTAPHVGLTVPDLEAAIAWYCDTLQFRLLAGPLRVSEVDDPLGPVAQKIYGEGFGEFHFAHLATPDDVGLELFQFARTRLDPGSEGFTYWKKGFNHLGLSVPDIESAVNKVVAAGGKATTEVLTVNPIKGYKIAYAVDPWGSTLELCSHPYVQMWST